VIEKSGRLVFLSTLAMSAFALCAGFARAASAEGALIGFDGARAAAGFSLQSAVNSLQKEAKDSVAPEGKDLQDPKYFTLDEKTVTIDKVGKFGPHDFLPGENKPIGLPKLPVPPTIGTPGFPTSGGDTISQIGRIINIAERVWTFIEKNKPIVEIGSHYANAIPASITHWDQLSEWNTPETTVYRFHAKNAYGMTMVDVTYAVLRTTGGKFNGKGRYLNGVTVMPIRVDVSWGYKLTMGVEIPTVSNVGTSEDPIAGMTANLTWSIETVVKTSRGTGVYYVRGDGQFKEVASPFN